MKTERKITAERSRRLRRRRDWERRRGKIDLFCLQTQKNPSEEGQGLPLVGFRALILKREGVGF
jgi:hypothetical protein